MKALIEEFIISDRMQDFLHPVRKSVKIENGINMYNYAFIHVMQKEMQPYRQKQQEHFRFKSLKREKMETLKLREDFIKLGQALKATGMVESGVEAKLVIQDGQVKVNGAVETQRGKKLVAGDLVEFEGKQIRIEE